MQDHRNIPQDAISNCLRLAAELRRLVDFAWPRDVRRCQHKHATMVQQDGELGWFVTWQCDDCGMPDRDRPVTTDDLAHGHDLPWFDREACLRGIERLEQAKGRTAMFFGKAKRR